MAKTYRIAGIGVALGLLGCATVATHQEYRAYRAIRESRDDESRLAALQRYASAYPGGLWSAEVGAERNAREEQVWASRNATTEGLQYYLAMYPDGTYVEQANQRIQALAMVQTGRAVEAEHVEEVRTEQRADAAEERRLWVTRAVTFWTRTLLGIRNYGQSIGAVARANPEFSQAFGGRPEPLCTPQACIKHYHAHYAIPVPGATRIERQIHVFLRILMNVGRVERVEVLLPNKGFSRWYELENRTLITDEDPAQRMQAIEWALQHIEPIFAELASGAHALDVVPEPIAPISQQAQDASARPEDSEGEVPGTPQPAGGETAAPAGQASESTGAGGGLDTLLEEAIGGGAGGGEGAPPADVQAAEPPPDTESLVLPIGLRALQRGNVRIVVFAAGEEDYGEAYDGFYIERVRE